MKKLFKNQYLLLLLCVLFCWQHIAAVQKILVTANDKAVVPFEGSLLRDSAMMKTVLARASIYGGVSGCSINGEVLEEDPFKDDLVISSDRIVLDKTLLTERCSGVELRAYKQLLALALGGMKDEVSLRLKNMSAENAFKIAWIADYLCSKRMKELVTAVLPYHLVSSFKKLGGLPASSSFLNNVFHWSDVRALWHETKEILPESFALESLPVQGIKGVEVVSQSKHSFILKMKTKIAYCWQDAGVWSQKTLYKTKGDYEVNHVLQIGSRRIAIVSYSRIKKKSKVVVLAHVGSQNKGVEQLARFKVSNSVDHIVYMKNNTFVWSSGTQLFRAQWYADVKNWIAEPCAEFTLPVRGLVVLGRAAFGVYSREEVQIFEYQALTHQWVCRYNRLFANSLVYGVQSVLGDRYIVCVDRLLIFLSRKVHGGLNEEACLGLPVLGAISLSRLSDSALILQGSIKSAVLLIEKSLSAYIRTFCNGEHNIISSFSEAEIVVGKGSQVLVAEPWSGTSYAKCCGNVEDGLAGVVPAGNSHAWLWDNAGGVYSLAPYKAKDVKALLAAACMRVHRAVLGKPLLVPENGWVAQASATSCDGPWLDEIMNSGYAIRSKDQCSIM